MGKKQHQSDKLYLTTKEWKDLYGGHKDDKNTQIQRAEFKRLPFSHCALSFVPFKDPVCSPEGVIFDMAAIYPYVRKHKMNPVNGKKMTTKDLIVLHFAKDDDGKFRCPVTYRVFTETSVIVAIRTTGNVYSKDAVDELNLKRNYLKDLLNETPFQRKDIITLQDPNDVEKFNMEKFYHVQFDTKTKAEIAAERKEKESPMYTINKVSGEARVVLDQLKKIELEKQKVIEEQVADKVNAAHYSQGKMAAGFTSTTFEPITNNAAAILADNVVRYSRVTKNGYVQIITNYGPLNLELYCKVAPKACENFIVHCKDGYYNKSRFHRLVPGFVLQGGDPTGTGKGGESIFGEPFEDEISGSYRHDVRGVLSMANKGTNTNKSQFFLTLGEAKNLDGKHTIFGKLVGGMQTLNIIEELGADSKDEPREPVYFIKAEVFFDPFEIAQQEVDKARAALGNGDAQPKDETGEEIAEKSKPKVYRSGVGKYIAPAGKRAAPAVAPMLDPGYEAAPKKKVKPRSTLGDFSSW
uniref:RING-type E3 ubiquitin transferase n=1 Tax=Panagrellus redivivus TaxID=6233 RepID=A0A7E4VCR6_PANRE